MVADADALTLRAKCDRPSRQSWTVVVTDVVAVMVADAEVEALRLPSLLLSVLVEPRRWQWR